MRDAGVEEGATGKGSAVSGVGGLEVFKVGRECKGQGRDKRRGNDTETHCEG